MIKKLFLTLTAAALAAACLPFAAVAAGAEDNAEPVPYTVDFFSAEAAEQLIPVYIPTDGTARGRSSPRTGSTIRRRERLPA